MGWATGVDYLYSPEWEYCLSFQRKGRNFLADFITNLSLNFFVLDFELRPAPSVYGTLLQPGEYDIILPIKHLLFQPPSAENDFFHSFKT
jgi:hypothetical protein